MLKRIKIKGYKSLQDVEVSLEPLTVLFGPNAAGKSNFLDALQLLSRIATSRTLKEAFDDSYRGKPLESFSFGSDGLDGLREKEEVVFSIEVDLELSDSVVAAVNQELRQLGNTGDEKPTKKITERKHRYFIKIGMKPKDGTLFVLDERLEACDKNWKPKKRNPFIEKTQENRIHLRMEGQAHPRYFDLRLDHTVLSIPHYAPHHPHLTAVRYELENWKFFYFEPRKSMREASSVKEVRHIGLMGEELGAFLNTLKNDEAKNNDFKGLEKSLQMLIPSIDGIHTETNRYGEVEFSLREQNVVMSSRLLSEGTLRLLGLLALTKGNSPPLVGFEEPENGVHPRRIRLIATFFETQERIGNSQFIITTHSPNLLDVVEPKCLFVVNRKQGKTNIDPFKDWGPLARQEVEISLNEEESMPVSDRLLRGDFDG